jgi:hypothetical protein
MDVLMELLAAVGLVDRKRLMEYRRKRADAEKRRVLRHQLPPLQQSYPAHHLSPLPPFPPPANLPEKTIYFKPARGISRISEGSASESSESFSEQRNGSDDPDKEEATSIGNRDDLWQTNNENDEAELAVDFSSFRLSWTSSASSSGQSSLVSFVIEDEPSQPLLPGDEEAVEEVASDGSSSSSSSSRYSSPHSSDQERDEFLV